MERVGLADRGGDLPSELSGGQQQHRRVTAVDNAPQLKKLLADDGFDVTIVDVTLPPTFPTEGLARLLPR